MAIVITILNGESPKPASGRSDSSWFNFQMASRTGLLVSLLHGDLTSEFKSLSDHQKCLIAGNAMAHLQSDQSTKKAWIAGFRGICGGSG
jgi:hypothetical protein